MKNLLALLAAALLIFAAVGWYLGWYQVKSESKDGHRQIHIDLNGPKISDDLEKGREKIRDLLTKKEKEAKQTVTPQGDPPAGTSPGSVTPADFRISEDGTFIYPGETNPGPPPPLPPLPPSNSPLPKLPPLPSAETLPLPPLPR